MHVDAEKVAHIPEGGGWRAHGKGGCDRHRSTGIECLHVAIDDYGRVAYAEELGDERKGTCAAFVLRAHAYFASLGITVREYMTDNGPGYRSGPFAEALASVGASHIFTRPYSPWQNGKVERMNQTLAREWAYARPYKTNAERSEALSAFLDHYNCDRPHSACGGLPPMSRVNNVLTNNS